MPHCSIYYDHRYTRVTSVHTAAALLLQMQHLQLQVHNHPQPPVAYGLFLSSCQIPI